MAEKKHILESLKSAPVQGVINVDSYNSTYRGYSNFTPMKSIYEAMSPGSHNIDLPLGFS